MHFDGKHQNISILFQDYSICSNTYPISGRNTQMSMEGEVITMMIKQDRETSLYDAPSSLPDFADIRDINMDIFILIIDNFTNVYAILILK